MVARPQSRFRNRSITIGFVAVIHIAVFWALSAALRSGSLPTSNRDIEVTIVAPSLEPRKFSAPPLSWLFEEPLEAVVPEPEIDIVPESQLAAGIGARAIIGRLAPSLDPQHVNQRPELPGTMGHLIAALSLRLRILVLPDGSVGDAQIAKSSGQAEIDQLALNWVRGNWRYVPATVNGKPTEAWITAIVRFAPIH